MLLVLLRFSESSFSEEETEEGRELPVVVVSPLEWLRVGSWCQETQGLQWDLSAEWSMLQTIYEGESSFSITEGRVGHQQFPNPSKMHNVNNSGDHTAWCFHSPWGMPYSFFHLLCIPISVSPLSLNLFLLPCCLTSTVPLVHTFALSFSLTLPYSQLFALARSLSFCAKRELKASQHSSVVRPGTSSWIEVFKLAITCAALNIVLLYLDAEDALS